MKEVLRFLGLAAALGVAAGMLLAGIALALAAPAYGMEPGLVLRAAGREAIAAPVVSTEVTFRISGPVARARVVQTFRSGEDQWTEGVYVFPLPESGAVDRLRLHIGKRLIEGDIEEERPDIFITRVSNVGPRETVVIELEYHQLLRYDGGRPSLRFPMIVGPRYVPVRPLRV